MKKAVFAFLIAVLSLTCIQPVFADTYTRYPPYDVGFSGGSGYTQGVAWYDYTHSVNLTNGIAKVRASVISEFVGGAVAEAWGFMGIEWTTPGDGGGGCPFFFTWNGTYYVLDNNLLPQSEMSNGTDVDDYYKLEQPPIAKNGKYTLLISEFEHEHDFIDQVKLIALDHASDVKIAVTSKGEILTYRQPLAPLSCIDNNGTSRLNEVVSMDGNVSDTTTYFEGYPGDYLILNFGRIASDNAKLILRTDMKKMDECIEVQVQNSSGMWQTVEVLVPRNYWSMEAVNLSSYVNKNEDLMVRLFSKYHHRLDYVGLDTTPQAPIIIHKTRLVSATHSKDGNVKSKLLYNDNIYTEILPGKQIELEFTQPDNQNEARTFVLYVDGHYVHTNEDDPIVAVSSKLTLKGSAYVYAFSTTPAGSRCLYLFQIWLWVYDVTSGSYVTKTLLDEKSEEAIAPGGFIPDQKSYTWNYDKDYSSTFNAIGGHKYQIQIGVYVGVKGATIGGGYVGALDFDSPDQYVVVQYIHLSW